MPRSPVLSTASLKGPARPRIPLIDTGASGRAHGEADAPTLVLGRAHEATGPARRVMAALAAGRLTGPVLWILRPGAHEALHPQGLAPFFDPSRLVIARPLRAEDTLWSAEEALRSGACPLVIAELDMAPGLTPMRRLNLAAEAGRVATGSNRRRRAPLMMVLFARGAGSGAAETRWRVDPAPGWTTEEIAGGAPRWRLERVKDKAGRPAAWEVAQPRAGHWRIEPASLAA